jgi:hypothetical protein
VNNLPLQFWPIAIIALGSLLAVVAYVCPGNVTAQHDLFTLASSLASGGLGAFIGQAKKGPDVNPQQ